MPATKIGISVPQDLYRSAEQLRKRTGKSRSTLFQEALRIWVRQQRQREWIQQYEAGYRAKPESPREIQSAEAAAIRLLSGQEW